jgi:hypothetical protein
MRADLNWRICAARLAMVIIHPDLSRIQGA